MGEDDHDAARDLAASWIEESGPPIYSIYEWHEIPSEIKGLLVMAAGLLIRWDQQQDQLITDG